MTDFGPFVKKTEIDFSVLNEHSLFLITGPTGSGKTTILDAMTFALFGEASGDMRLTENFKSDYSDLNELCCVRLEFQLRGRRYIVERYPKQKRISVRKNNVIVINSKAKLTLDDGEEIVGVENVNQKIEELFGLTYKQFKQIVILPQGEFKKLLEAKSEKKQEIFRKIFDTDIYERFCKVLLEKTKEIEKKIESQKLLMESYIGLIDIKDDDELKESVDEYFLNKSENKEANLNLLVLIWKAYPMKPVLQKPIPLYLAVCLIVQVLTYIGTRLITQGLHHYDMTTALDRSIPLIPATITVYLGCYLFWVINYALGCWQETHEAEHFLCAECFAKLICCVCFLLLPTTNIRPEINETGFFENAMRWLYRMDAADNLFPSIHCLTSWFCVIAVRKQKTVPNWWKVLSVVMALAVCISTLTTRQHVLADVIAGVLLAEGSYWFVRKSGWLTWYQGLLRHFSRTAEKEDCSDQVFL